MKNDGVSWTKYNVNTGKPQTSVEDTQDSLPVFEFEEHERLQTHPSKNSDCNALSRTSHESHDLSDSLDSMSLTLTAGAVVSLDIRPTSGSCDALKCSGLLKTTIQVPMVNCDTNHMSKYDNIKTHVDTNIQHAFKVDGTHTSAACAAHFQSTTQIESRPNHEPLEHTVVKLFTDANDPVIFIDKRITTATIDFLINRPCQPDINYSYPKTNGRSFNHDLFTVFQPNAVGKNRSWLSYSKSSDSAYCITCLLFGGPKADSTWTSSGFTGWHSGHGARGIERHEVTQVHRQAEITRFQYHSNCRIDQILIDQNRIAIEQNRRVVYVALKVVKFLATEMTALLGHNSYEGKFLHLFREFAEFDSCAAGYLAHLDKIRNQETKKKPEVNLLSPLNVRRLLLTMKKLVVNHICDQVAKQKAFSLINDGTQDLSKKDVQAVIVRYVSVDQGNIRPFERLVEVFTTGDSSGSGLYDQIVGVLTKIGLSFEWIVGQSYDGAGNVSGKHSGLQSRIQLVADKALYVWCHAHRLNLVVESVLSSSTEICGALGILQELYNFFAGYKKHDVLTKAQQNHDERYLRTLKRVSDTTRSWRSAEDGVNTLIECYECITDALDNLSADQYDANTVVMASSLLKRVSEFELIVILFTLQRVLSITGPVSRILQGVACDFAVAATVIQSCIDQFKDMRDAVDEYWQQILKKSKDFASMHDIATEFAKKRKRRIKRMADETAADEQPDDPEVIFKTRVFIHSIDVVLIQLNERFTAKTVQVMREMHFFSPKYLLSDLSDCVATDIDSLSSFYKLDCSTLARELSMFRPLYRQMHHLVSVTDLLPKSRKTAKTQDEFQSSSNVNVVPDTDDESEPEMNINTWADTSFVKPLRAISELSGFPTLNWLYNILISLAVTSSTAERAMSKVRIIKNRLRTTMLDDLFSSLMVLASEKDIVNSIPVDVVIDSFAACSAPLQKLLLLRN